MENKSTVNILDDIGNMFDDLADQLDAMLDWKIRSTKQIVDRKHSVVFIWAPDLFEAML